MIVLQGNKIGLAYLCALQVTEVSPTVDSVFIRVDGHVGGNLHVAAIYY